MAYLRITWIAFWPLPCDSRLPPNVDSVHSPTKEMHIVWEIERQSSLFLLQHTTDQSWIKLELSEKLIFRWRSSRARKTTTPSRNLLCMHCNFILTFEIYDIEIQDNGVKLIRKETDLQQPNSFRKFSHYIHQNWGGKKRLTSEFNSNATSRSCSNFSISFSLALMSSINCFSSSLSASNSRCFPWTSSSCAKRLASWSLACVRNFSICKTSKGAILVSFWS